MGWRATRGWVERSRVRAGCKREWLPRGRSSYMGDSGGNELEDELARRRVGGIRCDLVGVDDR